MYVSVSSVDAAWQRLERCYPAAGSDWPAFFKPRHERANFASRYHFVYPGLAMHLKLRSSRDEFSQIRSMLDVMYRGLIDERCWAYWHQELGETGGAIAERNLTYSGRLALFVGLYIDAFGEPPADRIEVDGDALSYSELAERLWRQMTQSPSCGVSCYDHQSMVPCNASLMINNLLHDRLFGTDFASANDLWMRTVLGGLIAPADSETLFYYGTEPDSPKPHTTKRSLGMDAWSLFLMSAVAPSQVHDWFENWRRYIRREDGTAWVPIAADEVRAELASTEWVTAWAMCLAAELGESELFGEFDAYMAPLAATGYRVDPYVSGLYALAHELQPGRFNALVNG